MRLRLTTLFLASRPKFLTASAGPVLVGTAMGYAVSGELQPLLFVLALAAIMALHAGANITNDYFDHTSRNDWVNQNVTPFSGGRRYIQEGILSPAATLLTAVIFLSLGAAAGIIIVLLTRSLFILVIGLAGLLGGYFYAAWPVRLGYRGIGEFVIMLLFGLLPVYGSYYLQTNRIDSLVLLPGMIVGILIFLIIFINEFPDFAADGAVGKKTLVVRLGVPASVWVYRIMLITSYVTASLAMVIDRVMFFPALLYLFTIPAALIAIKFANKKELAIPGRYRANQVTVLLHSLGCLALTAGFITCSLFAT